MIAQPQAHEMAPALGLGMVDELRARGLCKNCGPHLFNQKTDGKRQAFLDREVRIEGE